jgi:hypothetical protein
MRTARLALVVAALAVVCSTSPANAAIPTAYISMLFCHFDKGGAQKVPAGAKLDIAVNWGAETKAQIRQFKERTRMEASVGGVAIANANQYWGPLYWSGNTESWTTSWHYPRSGLARGQSIVVKTRLVMTQPVYDGQYTYSGPQIQLVCTLTGK